MAYTAYDDNIGFVDFYLADNAGPGPMQPGAGIGTATAGRLSYMGMEFRGCDFALGGASFLYAKAGTALTPGTIVEFAYTLVGGAMIRTAVAWAGTANQGKPLGVVMGTLAINQFGWFQVQGLAIVTCSGAPVAGNPVYWQGAGVVSPTALAGKQALNATFATAPAVTIGSGTVTTTVGSGASGTIVLSATQAVIDLQRPLAQGAIT